MYKHIYDVYYYNWQFKRSRKNVIVDNNCWGTQTTAEAHGATKSNQIISVNPEVPITLFSKEHVHPLNAKMLELAPCANGWHLNIERLPLWRADSGKK